MKRTRKKMNIRTFALLVLVALVLPLGINLLLSGGMTQAGERLATVAAVLGMPGQALDMLRERYRSELRGSEETAQPAPPPASSAAPARPEPQPVPQAPQTPAGSGPPARPEKSSHLRPA